MLSDWVSFLAYPNLFGIKSFVVVVLRHMFASKLGCKLGSLPITYLGFPLHNKKLSANDCNFLIKKIEHKL
jgi:hypothetical protein